MADKEYYEYWLNIRKELKNNILADLVLQGLAKREKGVKPQTIAVELVARVYCKYCNLYNKLADCYDQMTQVQRRPYIKNLIDTITCRIIELKKTFEEVEVFEYTYPDNALQQMLMIPEEVQIMSPFFYSYEIREKEMQYIIDQIMAGNRLGDPEPTSSELERREEKRLEEKEAEIKRKLAMGEDIVESQPSVIYSPEELEEIRRVEEYNRHLIDIQRMERCRVITREFNCKKNKEANSYLELAGRKAPPPNDRIRDKATALIQIIYRSFMKLKRDKFRERQLQETLGMIWPSWIPSSAKIPLEKVKEERRKFRQKYYEKWVDENIKEKSRVLWFRKDNIMEDISAEIRQWLQEWYQGVLTFDEFPWPGEGGSILIVKGETFTMEEYLEWREVEEKRLKDAKTNPKSKEQIKAEKVAAELEKKRLELEAKEKEEKKLFNYKRSRLKPDSDPGVLFAIGKTIEPVVESWNLYEAQWRCIDTFDAKLNAMRGHIRELITENAYHDLHLQLRPIVDEMMRLELKLLKQSLKADYKLAGVPLPLTRRRKQPKVIRELPPPPPSKTTPEMMFQNLVDEGIILKYPKTTLDEFWGDRNYAAAEKRAVLWTPTFPPPCLGDVRDQVRIRCLLTLGSNCPSAKRVHLIVGPKSTGKRTLAYAIASETNAILIDISPMNIYNKYPGRKIKKMFTYINKISRLMQPTIIFVEDADKIFYKRIPNEERKYKPARLKKYIFKEIVRRLKSTDKILVLGTASQPWLSKTKPMRKIFSSVIMIPRSDYGSIQLTLRQTLMKYHAIDRDFNIQSLAQTLRGFDVFKLRSIVERLLTAERIAMLYHKPLEPTEILSAVLEDGGEFTELADYETYKEWYHSYTPWGAKYRDYIVMIETQLRFKEKADKRAAEEEKREG